MKQLMTRHFSKWASKRKISGDELAGLLAELKSGNYEANLGGHLYKKRIRFKGKGKKGSGRTIICFKKGDRAIFIHGFSKNEKANLTHKELFAFKALSNILLALSEKELAIAIGNGDFIEVK